MSYYNYVDRYGEEKKFYGIVAPLSEDNQLIVFLVMIYMLIASLMMKIDNVLLVENFLQLLQVEDIVLTMNIRMKK